MQAPTALEKGEVLTTDDAAHYRAIFAAQALGHFDEADQLIAHVNDKILIGHVFADRYAREPASLQQLQTWLANYRDLPEAEDIYTQARALPGARSANLVRPTSASDIASRDFAYRATTGFRVKQRSVKHLSPKALSLANHVEASLRQGNTETAKAKLTSGIQHTPLPKPELIALQSRLAASFMYNGNDDEARRLTDVSYMSDDARALWVNGLSNFKEKNYAAAAKSFTTLAARDDFTDADHSAVAFWAYRSLKRSGNAEQAKVWLAEAASDPRSFYGMLANRAQSGPQSIAWTWDVPQLNQSASDILITLPSGKRAMALVQIGQNDLAEQELLRLNPQRHPILQKAMLALADRGHMANLAFKLGNVAVDDNGKPYDAALYPVPHWKPQGGFHVERALIYALMRHESQFDPLAVSSQGACGLMQLMPATAEKLSHSADTHKLKKGECGDRLFDPAINIDLGQRYVHALADQSAIGDNLLLLLAAYNGGPARLTQRNDIDASDDPLVFIESLPSQETHDYVQQVLMQYWRYRVRLNQSLKSLDQLASGNWPHCTLSDDIADRDILPDEQVSYKVASNGVAH